MMIGMMTQRASLLTTLLAILIVLAAFALAARASRAPFERLPHLEDEVAYLWQAKLFAGGNLSLPTPQPRRSYWQPFIVDHADQRFSKYPPGWPLLLAAGVLLGQPWIVNALLFALSTALTYRLGRELWHAEAGIIAALLTAISPMTILLAGSLMAHIAALWWGLLMTYALWRLTHQPHRRWAIIGGLALGMLFNTRPLTAVGLFAPFVIGGIAYGVRGVWPLISNRQSWAYLLRIVQAGPMARRIIWSGFRLAWNSQQWKISLATLLLITAAAAALLTPLHNVAATGDPFDNLYTYVWEYDRVGFGPGYGRYDHTLVAGLDNAGEDLDLWTRDLFGWGPGVGLSWVLLPVGLWMARRSRWAWLLIAQFGGLVIGHLAYWIGAQAYSARYYSEAVPQVALISAAGIVWLIQQFGRRLVYPVVAVLILVSLIAYTPPRLAELWRYNDIGGDDLTALDALRDGRPALIIVRGEGARSWRDWGAYMALTSPYLDSDVVAAREHGWDGELESILERFPDRQILELPVDGPLRPLE
jgi:hypothetical protein